MSTSRFSLFSSSDARLASSHSTQNAYTFLFTAFICPLFVCIVFLRWILVFCDIGGIILDLWNPVWMITSSKIFGRGSIGWIRRLTTKMIVAKQSKNIHIKNIRFVCELLFFDGSKNIGCFIGDGMNLIRSIYLYIFNTIYYICYILILKIVEIVVIKVFLYTINSIFFLVRSFMKKWVKIGWLDTPEDQDYPAAKSYLDLIFSSEVSQGYILSLQKWEVYFFKAKDIFRASHLSLLWVSNSHVKKDQQKIKNNIPLSPLLLVRDSRNCSVIIADGYHRLCAVYGYDEDAMIPCKITD